MNQTQLREAILEEKKKQNAVILAHVYQDHDVQEIADVTGDSFALAKAVQEIDAETVIMCGVLFMAETVKILSPHKNVILPEPLAGCPMAEQLKPEEISAFRKAHPDHLVAAYINTTAELKAVSDICVTSSSAVRILSRLDQKDILFIPDKNLAAFVQSRLPEKHISVMNGFCPAHNGVTKEDIVSIKKRHPEARVAAHPECRSEVLELADMVGATTEIIRYAEETPGEVIIVTERGVVDALRKVHGPSRFIQAVPHQLVCRSMKLTTLDSVYSALRGFGGLRIEMEEDLRLKAKRSIDNMLEYGK